jgi:hypothetical protein
VAFQFEPQFMRAALILISTFTTITTFAQDTHYWTYRYGTRAALMGGPAVGGLEDNSSVIYNPSLLSFVKNTSVSINANIYQIVNIVSKDGAGSGQDVISNQFSAVPITVSGLLPKSSGSKLTMGYSIIVPTEFTFKASAYVTEFKNIDTNETESPGDEDYVGQFSLNTRLSENLGAFALAYKLSNKWSIGLTNEFIYRSHNYAKNELARMILNNSGKTLVSTSEAQAIEYTNFRYAAKIGLSHYSDNWSMGIVVTAPSINLAGNATIGRDVVSNRLSVNIETNPSKPANFQRVDYSVNDRQTALPTTYKSPLSIAGGVCYRFPRWTVAASVEWFNSLSLYNIVSPADQSFRRPTSLKIDGKKFLQLNASNKSVVNFAIGVERKINEKINLSAGFRTNKSFYDKVYDQLVDQRFQNVVNNNALNVDISSWDINHVVIGGTFKKERRDLSLGINFSWASDGNLKQFANFDSPTESSFLLGKRGITSAQFYSYGILLGYTFRLRSAN